MEKPNKHDRILMICPNEKIERQINEFFARCGEVLILIEDFTMAVVALDENPPDFQEKIAAPLEQLFLGMIALYPNPAQIKGDIETLQNSLFANIKNKKKGH